MHPSKVAHFTLDSQEHRGTKVTLMHGYREAPGSGHLSWTQWSTLPGCVTP